MPTPATIGSNLEGPDALAGNSQDVSAPGLMPRICIHRAVEGPGAGSAPYRSALGIAGAGIDPNPTHRKALAETVKTAEWKMIYNRRTAIERLNSRLKGHRRLDSVRVRGRGKVLVHALLAVIVCQAQAVATESRASVRKVA